MVILNENPSEVQELFLSREQLLSNDKLVIITEDKQGRINEAVVYLKDLKNIELAYIKTS